MRLRPSQNMSSGWTVHLAKISCSACLHYTKPYGPSRIVPLPGCAVPCRPNCGIQILEVFKDAYAGCPDGEGSVWFYRWRIFYMACR